MRFFPDIYGLPRDEIARIQTDLLSKTVAYAAARSPFYRKRLEGIDPNCGPGGLASLATTSREDLQSRGEEFLAAPREEIAEIVSTTGTTGVPIFVPMTRRDVERLAENERRGFAWLGAGPGMRFHTAVTMDNLFVAGLAYHEGIRRSGAAAIRVGVQPARRHLDLLRTLRPEGMVAVPSMMIALARLARESGEDPRQYAPGKLMLIGDAVRGSDLALNATGRLIEESWGSEIYSTYGLTEAGAAFHECPAHKGLHAHPDILLAEVVDDGGRPLAPGEAGELVVTTLMTEGMPLIRYRTGDVTFIVPGECPCGRGGARIGPILGRKAHRLKVKGTTIYPKTIEEALVGVEGIKNFIIEARDGEDGTDRLVVRIGTDRTERPFLEIVRTAVFSKARVTPEIVLEPPASVESSLFEGGRRKPRVFVDSRGGGEDKSRR